MQVLFDTHTLAWWLMDSNRLPQTARSVIENPANSVAISAISAFEMATKYRIGNWPDIGPLVKNFELFVAREGFELLPLTTVHALRAGLLPDAHRDPFDRLLAGQSLAEGLPLMTNDVAFTAMGVETVW
jgi:PIN domain nuclease of toxin-antitoxin system